MLALRLEYLTGRAVATAYNDRTAAEWPPHPARVFSALVATWAEHDPVEERESTAEKEALEWLERLPPPAIACDEASARTVMTHFVPINDVTLLSHRERTAVARAFADMDRAGEALRALESGPPVAENASASEQADALAGLDRARAALTEARLQFRTRLAGNSADFSAKDAVRVMQLFPESRVRQPRTFPSLWLPDPVAHFVWPEAPSPPNRDALNRLAARLVRVGHSSSFVHARWVDAAPDPAWIPDDKGELLLRVIGPGHLARLRLEFELHQGVEPRVLPFRAQRYRSAVPGVAAAPVIEGERHYDARDWIVLRRTGGPPLSLTRTVDVALAVRGALLRHAESPGEEVLSGHAPNGQPSRAPHLIIQPLPNVGHRHADGRIMGVALVLPRAADTPARAALLRALGRWEAQARSEKGQEDDDAPTLTLGLGIGTEIEVERHTWGEPGAAALRSSTWCEASSEWISVTPVALDRNPGELGHRDPAKSAAAHRAAAEIVARACENVGLPLPQSVEILPSGTWPGFAKAAQFPAFPSEPGKLRRVKVHARLRFSQGVAGPIILGAGRFVGLGLFRPVREQSA